MKPIFHISSDKKQVDLGDGTAKGFDIGFQLLKNSFISIHQVNFKDSETNFRNCQQTSYNKFNNLKVESYKSADILWKILYESIHTLLLQEIFQCKCFISVILGITSWQSIIGWRNNHCISMNPQFVLRTGHHTQKRDPQSYATLPFSSTSSFKANF